MFSDFLTLSLPFRPFPPLSPTCHLVSRILSFLSLVRLRGLADIFLWIPSHVGILYSGHCRGIAKAPCSPPSVSWSLTLSVCYLLRVNTPLSLPSPYRARQRANSVSLQHYTRSAQKIAQVPSSGPNGAEDTTLVAASYVPGYRPCGRSRDSKTRHPFPPALCDNPTVTHGLLPALPGGSGLCL
ncbi:hypothetical protein GWK47_026452 [Chionoecetes opilio]|uniref:Uncharacterized protein n=1 Tax=Chionoecetes opilio TaxID=41210 RepID=A0A8J8WEL8_CHIOP|nr:hypothetical protein GWK47_026452 [Chionoecetes opilio]